MSQTQEELDTRFQNQPWYIRLWRFRWYLLIPYWVMRSYGNHWMAWNDDSKEWDIPGDREGFILAVKLAVGTAQSHMRWWYTIDEVLSDEDSI